MAEAGGRDRHALMIAMLLLAVGLFGASLATAWALHQHHQDVAALHRDPSYIYGNELDVFGPPFNSTASSKQDACTRYLRKHPARFDGFKLALAVHGCVDEWDAASD